MCDSDIAELTTTNSVQKAVKACKEHHNGPIVSEEELSDVVSKTKDLKELHKILNLEIKYRKVSMLKVKASCPLFLQRKLSIEEKVKNIGLLMKSQELGMKALASMSDLAAAIHNRPEANSQNLEGSIVSESLAEDSNSQEPFLESAPPKELVGEVNTISLRLSERTNLDVDEFVIGVFENGFFPGQIIEDKGKQVRAMFMTEVFRKDSAPKTYWKWPSPSDIQTLDKDCLFEIRPNIDVVLELSTRRCTIYKMFNLELVEKFV